VPRGGFIVVEAINGIFLRAPARGSAHERSLYAPWMRVSLLSRERSA